MAIGSRITPIEHEEAERIVQECLERHGYAVQPMAYHHYFDPGLAQIVGRCNQPTSLYVRTLADRLAVKMPRLFEVEVKDELKQDYPNASVEVFPLLIHTYLYLSFGVDCLYAFVFPDDIKACWAQCVKLKEIIIPQRWRPMEKAYWEPKIRQYFGGVPLRSLQTGGSGDPFGLVPPAALNDMKSIEAYL